LKPENPNVFKLLSKEEIEKNRKIIYKEINAKKIIATLRDSLTSYLHDT
jgi:hypothetical protein